MEAASIWHAMWSNGGLEVRIDRAQSDRAFREAEPNQRAAVFVNDFNRMCAQLQSRITRKTCDSYRLVECRSSRSIHSLGPLIRRLSGDGLRVFTVAYSLNENRTIPTPFAIPICGV